MKKGQGLSTHMRNIMLFLVVLLILLFVYKQIWGKTAEVLEDQNCKDSVLVHSRANIDQIEMIDELNCNTRYYPVSPGQTDDAIKRQLADAMFHCYDNFWQGRLDIFSAGERGAKRFCVICSVFEFEEDRNVYGMMRFLMTKRIPRTKDTYYNFLTPYSTTPELIDRASQYKEKADNISMSQPYAILFTNFRQEDWSALKQTGVGGVTGGVGLLSTAVIATAPIPGVNIGVLGGAVLLSVGGTIGAYHAYQNVDPSQWVSSTVLYPYKDISLLGCQELRDEQSRE